MQAIPGHIKSRLFSILGSHNLAPVACGSQSGLITVEVNSQYRMCAFPNSQYTSGTYTINVGDL